MMAKKKASTRSQAPRQVQAASMPNIYWRSMTMDQLRQEERCVALPQEEEQHYMGGIHSHRYVRQDSHLWSVLHDGMLTTGRLKAALGMHESTAAGVIGIHPGSRGSSHLLAAYTHLVNTTYSRKSPAGPTSNTSSSNSSSHTQVASTDDSTSSATSSVGGKAPAGSQKQKGAKQVSRPAAIQQQQQRFGGLLPRPVMLQQPARQYHTNSALQQQQQEEEAAQQQAFTNELQQQQQQQHQEGVRQQREQDAASVRRLECERCEYNQQLASGRVLSRGTLQGTSSSNTSATDSHTFEEYQAAAAAMEAARQHSERAAAGGDVYVKMCWGKTQEAAALYCVMHMFPEALLEEVGLFELDACQLPPSWGLESHLLPPLGASPDAVLVHRITLMPEDLQAAAVLLTSKSNNSTIGMVPSPSTGSGSLSCSSAAECAAVQLLLQRGFDRLACAGVKPSCSGVQYADSSSSDGSTVPSSSGRSGCASADANHELDCSSRSSNVLESTQHTLEAGAAVAGCRCSSGLGVDQVGSLAFEPVGVCVLRVLQRWQQRQQQGQGQQHQGQVQGQLQAGVEQSGVFGADGSVSLIVREAVEVKNHCPFSIRYTRSGRKGRVDLAYKLSPRGCVGRVHPQWVPQLQLHMLATGCQSVLLASRCAATGVRLHRMWRDDAYLRDMMHLLQELQAAHVLCQVPPRPDSLSRLASHRPFLNRTVALARGAECVAAVGEEFVADVPVNAVNREQFWQPV